MDLVLRSAHESVDHEFKVLLETVLVLKNSIVLVEEVDTCEQVILLII
jgi:hypothetical protein